MKVILGCDPLLMPLAGIGQYTQNLGLQLVSENRLCSLELFAHGRFFDSSLLTSSLISEPKNQLTLFGRIRSNMAKSLLAVNAYESIMPPLNRWRLRNHSGAIFHSPNFIMPNFNGKSVVTIHDLSTLRFPDFHPKARVKFVNNTIKNSCQKADLIVTDSEFVREEILETYSVEPDRIVCVHLGAQEKFHPRTFSQCSELLSKIHLGYKRFFLFVSTLEPRKNIGRLLQAYSDYRLLNSEALPLILVGGIGWKDASFTQLLSELTDKGWVKRLGYLDSEDLAILYSAARALIFPSIYEGFGLPVLEAMQSGTAVITSENSSMSEVCGDAGKFVNPYSIEEICDALDAVQNNDTLVLGLCAKGLERAKHFSWKKCGDSMMACYASLDG